MGWVFHADMGFDAKRLLSRVVVFLFPEKLQQPTGSS